MTAPNLDSPEISFGQTSPVAANTVALFHIPDRGVGVSGHRFRCLSRSAGGARVKNRPAASLRPKGPLLLIISIVIIRRQQTARTKFHASSASGAKRIGPKHTILSGLPQFCLMEFASNHLSVMPF